MPRSDLPFGSEFSPAQVELPVLLELASEHATNWKAFEAAVRDRYFAGHETSDYNRNKLANNTKLSLRAYGLIGEDDATLTETGRALYSLRHDEDALYRSFAQHILKNRQGMNFVQCILDMQGGPGKPSTSTRYAVDSKNGISPFRAGGKHMSTLRLWLERAGVFVHPGIASTNRGSTRS